MIGIFDSGVGGFASLGELRRLIPHADITYLADRNNAPYGRKTKDELIGLVKKDISVLRALGAKKILIACCTASAIHEYLPKEDKEISFPIIKPAAKRAAALGKRITVIATEYTVGSGAFSRAIAEFSGECRVKEISAQSLVSLAESEVHGEGCPWADALLWRTAEEIEKTEPEVLILGCTHFSHLEKKLTERLSGVITVSPAVLGARALCEELSEKGLLYEEKRGATRLRYL